MEPMVDMSKSWIEVCEAVARKTHGGHLTLMRFGTGWKAVFGTPDLFEDHGYIWSLRAADSASDACRDLLFRSGL